jgi:hypothetical protein
MKVYLICISAADSGSVLRIAGNPVKAWELMREERDKLVSDWKQMIDFIKKEDGELDCGVQMYEKMIQNLSGDNFEEWNNYPHDTIKLEEWEVEE